MMFRIFFAWLAVSIIITVTLLVGDPWPDQAPQWSPSGQEVAFLRTQAGNRIYQIDINATDVITLIHSRTGAVADWSPDGTRIVYVNQDIHDTPHIMSADGNEDRAIGKEGEYQSAPVWSPDSRLIVFEVDGEIGVIDGDGTHLAFLASGYQPSWSPNGRQIAYTTFDHPLGVWMRQSRTGLSPRRLRITMVT